MLRQELSGLGTPDVCSDLASLSRAFQHFIIRNLPSSQRLLPTPLEREDNRSLFCYGVWLYNSLLSQTSPFGANVSFSFSLFSYFLAFFSFLLNLLWTLFSGISQPISTGHLCHQGAESGCWCLQAWIGLPPNYLWGLIISIMVPLNQLCNPALPHSCNFC